MPAIQCNCSLDRIWLYPIVINCCNSKREVWGIPLDVRRFTLFDYSGQGCWEAPWQHALPDSMRSLLCALGGFALRLVYTANDCKTRR